MTASAMESSIEVQNLGELKRDLTALAAKLTKRELVPILRPGAKVMQKAIKQRVPVRTGVLKRAVKVKVGKGKATAPYATLMTYFGKVNTKKLKGDAFYGFFVHNGTIVGADGKRIRLKSYKAKAYDWMSGIQKQYQREADKARAKQMGTQRIKPNPFVYDAYKAHVQQVANEILSKIESNL